MHSDDTYNPLSLTTIYLCKKAVFIVVQLTLVNSETIHMKCLNCSREVEDTRYARCERCLTRARDWQKAHYNKEKKRLYRIKNRERTSAASRAYYDAHKEKLQTCVKEWYRANKEQHFKNVQRWKETHPDEWEDIKLKGSQKRRARLNNATGSFTSDEIKELAHKQANKCYYCNKLFFNGNLNQDRHIEHKTPLSRGGSNDISNIVLSCSKCNREKYTKTAEEFLAVSIP